MRNDITALFLPYCLQRIDDGRYVVLNRQYKPLGRTGERWVEYADFAVAIPQLDAAAARQLSHAGSDALDRIFLYRDACKPTASAADWAAYAARLAKLAHLRVTPD